MIDSLGASGAEHSTAAMMPLLRDLGHEVGVATLYDAGFGDEERVRADGFVVQPLHSRRYLGRVRELRARIRAERPDVVHTTLFACDMVGRLAAVGTGAKVVSSLVNTTYDPARGTDPNLRGWKLRAVQLLDGITGRLLVHRFHAVSPGVAEANARDLRVPPARIDVVQRGRSRDRLGTWSAQRRGSVRASLGIGPQQPLVLAVGRHEHQKAHTDLVAASELLAQRVPEVRVLVAGREGNATAGLHQALAQHSLAAGAISLLGHRHDVPDLICAADVLAIPSLYEGTAGVALEAMALRCPVVCTDLPGVRGVLATEQNAVLVPVGDPAAMAAALERVLADHELADRLRDRGLADFEARYDIHVAAAAMEAFYADVVANGRRRAA
ncbi:MAG: glycosyltransferase family 4 protein [Actinomycetota bacterium]|nr:glycosyltransferase family 4 protein [Actinomycetota bacterium]